MVSFGRLIVPASTLHFRKYLVYRIFADCFLNVLSYLSFLLFQCFGIGMPPKTGRFTADDFEKKYGKLVRDKYAEHGTAYKLDQALQAHKPPICMTQGVLKQWLLKYGKSAAAGNAASSSAPPASAAISIKSCADLQEKFGHVWSPPTQELLAPLRSKFLVKEIMAMPSGIAVTEPEPAPSLLPILDWLLMKKEILPQQ